MTSAAISRRLRRIAMRPGFFSDIRQASDAQLWMIRQAYVDLIREQGAAWTSRPGTFARLANFRARNWQR